MNDLTLYSTADETKRNLTSRFVISGIVGVLLIVTCLTAGGYFRLQTNALNEMARRVSAELQRSVALAAETLPDNGLAASSSDVAQLAAIPEDLANAIIIRARRITGVSEIILFDAKRKKISELSDPLNLNSKQSDDFRRLAAKGEARYEVYGHDLLGSGGWWRAVIKDYENTQLMTSFQVNDGTPGVALMKIDHQQELATARSAAIGLMLFLFFSTMLLFLLLYFNFRRGIKTIEDQEERLNHQIARLSNLLTVNKSMQKSMKTASARAVELNEQFLRRVGADLHDGPAQMIGFAVLRLNQVSKQEAAKQLSHEFHTVRDALDESLEEIRGISSGLVLPELEQMSMEQCLRKVVTLHGSKSDTEVSQFYQDLSDDIPLPVKICAYRFVQEGLNNAHRHGQAKKCRLNAFVKDDILHLSLKDNGMGFRKSSLSAEGGHLGLMGLKDRIESLGGKFNINSELGVGTALKLSISLKDVD